MIHDDHPFRDPPAERDPVRQFRGRLVAPVTVVTAGTVDRPAALTVSSLMVAEGQPSSVVLLIGSTTDLWDAMAESTRFVVHVLDRSQRDDADAFAGLRPRPGGVFSEVRVEPSDWGPVLSEAPNRIYCRLDATTELPFHQLVVGEIERVEIAELEDPAVYFRGEHRKLEP